MSSKGDQVVRYSANGKDRLDLEIDETIGLEPHDPDAIAGMMERQHYPERFVQVNIVGPSSTDRILLDELKRRVNDRLSEFGKTGAYNIDV